MKDTVSSDGDVTTNAKSINLEEDPVLLVRKRQSSMWRCQCFSYNNRSVGTDPKKNVCTLSLSLYSIFTSTFPHLTLSPHALLYRRSSEELCYCRLLF